MRAARWWWLLLLGTRSGWAQAPGPVASPQNDAPGASDQAPAAPNAAAGAQPGSAEGTVVYRPLGLPLPGTDVNAGVPSSSRPVQGDQRDGFDLDPARNNTPVVFGEKGASAVLSSDKPLTVPDLHVVRKGDTLWDLCGYYYQNSWQWPKVWSYNPQITNPHWIYPGDQLRLRHPNDIGRSAAFSALSNGQGGGLVNRRGLVPENTVFLRDQGFLGDPKRDVWGELVGAVEEQMLLSDGNHVYLSLRKGQRVQPGDELTVFRSVRQPEDVPGARKPPGEIVAVNGTVRIDSFNEKTRIARAQIVESVDVIERGAKVGPVGRRFDVVPPKKSTKEVKARVLTSLYPHVYLAQNQVVFLDRGSSDGLEPGHTLTVFRKGDTWRKSLGTASKMVRDRVRMDSPRTVEVETTPLRGDPAKFPPEAVAELRVLRTEKYSSLALVTQSRRELVPGDQASSRAGY